MVKLIERNLVFKGNRLTLRMKILIVQCKSLTRVVQSTPIVRALKTQLDAEVYYLTSKELILCISANPYIKAYYAIEDDSNRMSFDILIDLQNSRLTRRLNIQASQIFRYRNEGFKEWLFFKFQINQLPNKHLIDRYFKMIAPIGIKEDSLGLDYFIPTKDEVEPTWLPGSHQSRYAAVCIAASAKTMQLSKSRLIELCDRINKPIVLIGTREDQSLGDEIVHFFEPGTSEEELEIEQLNKKAIIFNACGKFNINQQASLIKNSSWVFSYQNDTMHIAAAFKKKVYTIWGSSSPYLGEYPYRTSFVIFENKQLSCRPCSRTGYNKCPKGHFKCMNSLTFDFYLPD